MNSILDKRLAAKAVLHKRLAAARRSAAVLGVSVALFALQASAATLAEGFTGATYYVSTNGNDSAAGTSWATAKRTIQAGLDLCTANGCTVIVGDGIYTNTTDVTISGTAIPTVAVLSKATYLKALNRGKAVIEGALSTADATGTGAGAHRGIYVTAEGTGSLVEGFTIRNCATVGTASVVNNAVSNGGGMTVENGKTAYAVFCTFDNCRAGQGGATGYDVRIISCLVKNCRATGMIQLTYRSFYAYNCIFVNNGVSGSYTLFSNVQKTTVIGCTFIRNKSVATSPNAADTVAASPFYNCLFLDNNSAESSNVKFVPMNCFTTGTNATDRIVSTAATASNACGISRWQCLAPGFDDFRLVKGSVVVDKGNDDYGTLPEIPAEYRAVDYYGNPRKVGAHVDVGAVEAQDAGVTPATAYVVPFDALKVTALGETRLVPGNCLWFAFDAFPGQVRLASVEGDRTSVYGFSFSGCWETYDIDSKVLKTGYRYPDLGADCGFWMTLPPTAGTNLNVDVVMGSATKRVASDGTGDFTTIQAALDWVAAQSKAERERTIILVAPGRYTGTGDTCLSITNSVAIRSEQGPEKTIIDGEGTRRCVKVPAYTCNMQVQGFTLTGGYSATDVGAAFLTSPFSIANNVPVMNSVRPQMTDCIVSNNVALYAAGQFGGWSQRCLFTDNRALSTDNQRGTAVRQGLLSGCLVCDNASGPISAVAYAFAYNCTFAEPSINAAGAVFRAFDMHSSAFNSIVCGSYIDNLDPNAVPSCGCVGEGVSGGSWMTKYAVGEVLVDGAARDLRLLGGSEAMEAGATPAFEPERYLTGDYAGNAIRYFGDNPVPGGLHTVAPTVSFVKTRGFAVTPKKVNVVTPGETVTLGYAPDAFHPVSAWVVNGVTNATAATSLNVTLPKDAEVVKVELVANADLYVNANAADDSGNALTPETARRTLASLLPHAWSGDTVHAAAGDYSEGATTYEGAFDGLASNTTPAYMPSRVVVPKGVTLASDEGAEQTFITGNRSETMAEQVRCVTLLAGATIRGFTLRDGQVTASTGTERCNNAGGGVLAPWPSGGAESEPAIVENCRVTNCKARTGGGVYGGIVRNCRLIGNTSTSGGTCTQHSRVESSFLHNTVGQTSVRDSHGFYSSTLYTTAYGHVSNWEMNPVGTAPIVNSVVLSPNCSDGKVIGNVHNVVWCEGAGSNRLDEATCSGIVRVSTPSLAAVGLDDDGRPTGIDALVVDKGDTSALANLANPTVDLAGNPRVSNANAVDIGAYEFDWRPIYAATLLTRRFEVTTADPSAFEKDGNSAVLLPAGALTATWRGRSGSLAMPLEVTGSGTLTVMAGERTLAALTAADGLKTLRLDAEPNGVALAFAYEPGENDSGAACLHAFSHETGLLLIVR